jgi:lysophospholipase L1-like esterase
MPWLLLHDRRRDSTAKYYVDSTDRVTTQRDRWVMYWKAVRVVNSLSASAHKTTLLNRLATIKETMYGQNYKRVIVDLAINGKTPTTGINNATEGNTGSSYPNLVDENNASTSWTFSVPARAINGTEEVVYGDNISMFGGYPGTVFDDSWDVFDNPNPGTWRISGLDNTKKYTIVMSGSGDVTPPAFSYTYQTGFIATIGSVSDTVTNQIKNTVKYVHFYNVSPVGGNIDILVKSFANDSHAYVAFIEVVEQGSQQSGGNTLPNVSAGSDQTIRLPTNSVTLNGSASDPDGSIAGQTWTKLSGPATYTITSPSSLSTTVTGLVEGVYVFRLQASDNLGGEAFDDVQITVQPSYHVPPTVSTTGTINTNVPTTNLSATYTTPSAALSEIGWVKVKAPSQPLYQITVVGSSTAQGYGLAADSAFVGRLKKYYKDLGVIDTIYNLGVSATNIFGLNITNALNKGGEILLVNFPSNGYEGSTYSIAQIIAKYQEIMDSCTNRGVQFYTTGTQPREDFNSTDRTRLNVINDSLKNRFGNRFINFMSIVKDTASNLIRTEYTQGDGLHINAAGHERFMQACVARGMFNNLVNSFSLISTPTTATTAITGLTDGDHKFAVSVLDAYGFAATANTTVTATLTTPPCQGIRRVLSLGGWNDLDMAYVQPGDTIVINAGNYGFLQMKNLNGTQTCPIVIINQGGQVVLEAFNIDFPSEHVIINGRGHAGTNYGFRMANSNYFGMHIKCQGPIEVFNIEIHNVSLGLQVKYGDVFPSGLTYHRGIKLHNMYIHHIVGNEGMYVGSSSSLSYPKIDTVHIYDILIDSTAREGLQISNAQQVLVERVKIIDPSFANGGSQNHGFNMGWDTEGTARDMYIQTSPGYTVFFNGGRVKFECSTIEHINRGFATTLSIFGKNFEFNDPLWDEPYQQFTFKNLNILNTGGISIESTTAYGPLQSNTVENIKLSGGTTLWGPGSPAPSVTNVGPNISFNNGCVPPLSTTTWGPNWPAYYSGTPISTVNKFKVKRKFKQ